MLRTLGIRTRQFSTAAKNLESILTKNVDPNITPILPPKKVVILPPTADIAEQYEEEIRSGRMNLSRYTAVHETDAKKLQPVYTSDHNYRHTFVITELTHNDFLKKIGYIERQLNKKFGSTYNIRVRQARPRFHKRWTLLKSVHVNKKAQQHIDYFENSYELSVSYAFELTDPVVNDYVYNTLKNIILATGGVKKFGYTIKHQPRRLVNFKVMAPGPSKA